MVNVSEETQPAPGAQKVKASLWAILALVVAGYVGFVIYQSVYFNYKTSQKIRDLKVQLAELEDDKGRLEALTAYYKTDTFQELEARKKLGLKLPGEKVVKVGVEQPKSTNEEAPVREITQQVRPNWKLWLDFFSGREI